MAGAATRTQEAGTKLARTTAKLGYEDLFKAPVIEQPEQGLYGVLQQGYGQALTAASAADPGGGGPERYALGAGADREKRDFEAQLLQAQQAQAIAQDKAIHAGLTLKRWDKQPDDQFVGESSIDANNNVVYDPKLAGDQNINTQTEKDDAHLASVMGSFGEAAKAGYYFDPGIVSQTAGSLNAPDRYSGLVNVIGLPGEPGVFQTVAEKEKERDDRARAENDRITANRSGADHGVKLTYVPGADRGVPGTFSYSGDPAAVAPYIQEPAPNNAAPPPNTHTPPATPGVPTQTIPDAPGVPLAQKREMATRLGWKVIESGGYTIITKPGAEPAFYLPDGTRVKR